MSQAVIDSIQSFAILCIAFACICNSLCVPMLKDYDKRFSLMYWLRRVRGHFQRQHISSTGVGGSSQMGKQANENDFSRSPRDVSKTSDSQPTAQEESTKQNSRLRNR